MSLSSLVNDFATAVKDKFNTLLAVHDKGSLSGAVVVDYSDGSVQWMVASAAITALSFSNLPASGSKGQLVLYIDMASDLAVTFVGVTGWAGDNTAPTLKSGRNELVFTTIDGGTKLIGHTLATGM